MSLPRGKMMVGKSYKPQSSQLVEFGINELEIYSNIQKERYVNHTSDRNYKICNSRF